jgi:hypothetical protein
VSDGIDAIGKIHLAGGDVARQEPGGVEAPVPAGRAVHIGPFTVLTVLDDVVVAAAGTKSLAVGVTTIGQTVGVVVETIVTDLCLTAATVGIEEAGVGAGEVA